ncbi:enoyl-CoA hydratase-related protein [Actinocrispum sp. NPDC049592]|uniref:enoyl-CoA hydratase-related protein n=1 Tax=Actinocrispum sp. NPDC049592 TaxID=3154835 RepID=UPI003441F3AB
MTAVRTDVDGKTLVITLDRPKVNAIDVATSHELYAAFDRLQQDRALRVAIITGSGEFFSAGWDLKAGEAVDADHGPGGFAGLTELFTLDKPVIAAVNGPALGGGFELALAADLIVAGPQARFALPEATLGLVPDSGGVLRLPKRLPRAIAMELLLTGRRMSAEEALAWGLVNRVDADPVAAALALARMTEASAPLAISAIKEIISTCETESVADGYRIFRRLPRYQAVLASDDAVEGPRAFGERRPPVWLGS